MTSLRVLVLVAAVSLVGACSGSSPLPAPSPAPSPSPVPVPSGSLYAGTVVATNGGGALPGVTVTFAGQSTITGPDGAFRFSLSAPAASGTVQLSGAGIVPRSTSISVSPQSGLRLDVFWLDGVTFDLAFYRLFARNGFEAPSQLHALLPRSAISLYIRTIDDAGRAIDSATLDATQNALQGVASTWGGGRVNLGTIERGTDTREGVAGWTTIRWQGVVDPTFCGTSQIGADGGWIRLNYLEPRCGCPSLGTKILPVTVRHELGHAYGYWHTGNAGDLMSGLAPTTCDQLPSVREVEHAKDMYRRTVGNTDPDNDPTSAAMSARLSLPIIIRD